MEYSVPVLIIPTVSTWYIRKDITNPTIPNHNHFFNNIFSRTKYFIVNKDNHLIFESYVDNLTRTKRELAGNIMDIIRYGLPE